MTKKGKTDKAPKNTPETIDEKDLDAVSGGPAYMKLGDIKGDVSLSTNTSLNTSISTSTNGG